MKLLILFSNILIFVLALGCSQDENAAKSALNPNGDSELALLMRAMYDDGMRLKLQIENGEKPDVRVDYEKILTAKPTSPEMIAIPGFEAFAQSYIQAAKALHEAPAEQGRTFYEGLVASCTNCHNAGCTGPLMRIKNLSLSRS
jgi:cytochrome c553